MSISIFSSRLGCLFPTCIEWSRKQIEIEKNKDCNEELKDQEVEGKKIVFLIRNLCMPFKLLLFLIAFLFLVLG